MKLPFTYRQNFFNSLLAVSFVAHGALFVQAGNRMPSPEYGVVQAPASVQVVLIEEKVEPKPELKEKVMTAMDPADVIPEVRQEEPEEEKPEPEEKPVFIPPVKGAITESQPEYLKNPAPDYPFRARQRGWEGVVLLKVLVSKDGRVAEIKLAESSGHRILDEAALQAVKGWQFKPASLGSFQFSSWIEIPVRFILEESI